MKKKIILSFLIAILIFNALLPNSIYATNGNNTTNTTTNTNNGNKSSAMDSYMNSSARKEVKRQNEEEVEQTNVNISQDKSGTIGIIGKDGGKEPGNQGSVIVNLIAKFVCLPVNALQLLMAFATKADNELIYTGSIVDAVNSKNFDAVKMKWFTIQNAVLNKIPILDINFFNIKNNDSEFGRNLKQSVATWYQTIFLIAQVASIVVLIYIGIRMVISSTSEKQVNYKKMLKNWVVGFAMLFLLPYVMIIIINANEFLISLIPSSLTENNMEINIISKTIGVLDTKDSVWSVILYVITYWVIVGFEFTFFWMYFKRLVTVAFLIIIAPLITVTYAIDKADDGKAQAYTTWMSLFLGNVFMQAVQAFMYAIFIYSASAISEKAPIIAILFFLALTKGENVVNKFFNLNR